MKKKNPQSSRHVQGGHPRRPETPGPLELGLRVVMSCLRWVLGGCVCPLEGQLTVSAIKPSPQPLLFLTNDVKLVNEWPIPTEHFSIIPFPL